MRIVKNHFPFFKTFMILSLIIPLGSTSTFSSSSIPESIAETKQYYTDNYSCYEDSFTPSCQDFQILESVTINGKNVPGVDILKVSYTSDGYRIFGFVIKPTREGIFPLIVYNHGGTLGVPENAFPLNVDLARSGAVIVMSAYRGENLINDNIDRIVVNTENNRSEGEVDPYEIHDVLNLMECGKTLEMVDPNRIGMFGSSHGGLLTLLALERSDEIDVGAFFYGYNILQGYLGFLKHPSRTPATLFSPSFRSLVKKDQLDYINKADPMLCLDKIQTPLLVIVGDNDTPDIYDGTIQLIEKLKESNANFEYKVYPDEGHSFNLYLTPKQKSGSVLDAYERLASFFRERLGALSSPTETGVKPVPGALKKRFDEFKNQIKTTREAGYDISEPRSIAQNAREAFQSGDRDKAEQLLEEAFDVLNNLDE